ncbi:MAG TPA: glycosyltransferase family 39 protein, partial [Isosphaeraceae bacterium]|nr:glycosyltransferase family 39 protein [Isosphaeraceae bacterium]
RFSRVLILLAFASLYTAQNATKPPTIDDVFYHHYAVQISQAPLDPYGFSIFYDQAYRPAHQVLAPPVFLYWWGLGLRLVGNDPTLWKFWLFPFSLLLVVTFHDLARRFARGTELWLTALLLFSPAFLPSLNLMLDIPALALGLAALSLFARASETRSWSLALGAGGLATLSMQTKYTGLLVPPLLLLYAGFARNLRLGSLSVAVSATLFVGWELVVAHLYGTSHFLLHLTRNPPNIYERIRTILALPTLLGSVSIPLLLLAASVLNLPRWARGLLWIFSTGTYLAIGMNYFEIEIIGRLFRLETLLFGLSGLILGVMLLIVLFRVLPANREVWFLAAW